jgi:hypothetical protein
MGGGEALLVDSLGRVIYPSYKQRVTLHEAGHFLVAYLVGLLPRDYALSGWDAFQRCGWVGVLGVAWLRSAARHCATATAQRLHAHQSLLARVLAAAGTGLSTCRPARTFAMAGSRERWRRGASAAAALIDTAAWRSQVRRAGSWASVSRLGLAACVSGLGARSLAWLLERPISSTASVPWAYVRVYCAHCCCCCCGRCCDRVSALWPGRGRRG